MFLTILIFVLIAQVNSKPLSRCPEGCVCDKYEKLKRISCVNQNLLNIDDIPSKVQILDISYNQISQLGDHEFLDLRLTSLELLNISHNRIGHMHLNAFRGLDRIKAIDLSYNALEYFLHEWFYDLKNLNELYLSNNNFASLPDGPILESNSLKVLDLSNSRISHIKPEAFSKLPAVEKLLLDGNYLIQLNVITVSVLNNLQTLSVKDNPFACDGTLTDLEIFVRNVGINYRDSCKDRKLSRHKSDKFERMVLAPSNDRDDKNTWIDEDLEEETKVEYKCIAKDKNILTRITEKWPVLVVTVPFIFGTVFGITFVYFTQMTVNLLKPKKKKLPERRRRYSIIRRTPMTEFTYPLVLNCENIYESTPVPQRKIGSRIEMYSL